MDEKAITKNRRWIAAVIIIGLVLAVADIFVSMSANSILMVRGSDDNIYMIRPGEGDAPGHIDLKAEIVSGDENFEKNVTVTLDPFSKTEASESSETEMKTMSDKERAEYEFRNLIGNFNSDRSIKRIKLPQKLHSGAEIKWEIERKSNSVVIIFLTFLAAFMVYRNRFTVIKREREQNENSVLNNLPEFLNRLVLLLNAGLVLNTAFEKIIAESAGTSEKKDDYFNRNMSAIYDSVKYANGSVNREFRIFAQESGIKELIRISNIINDNIHKGAELNEKLETESENLWISRKKMCEERGRMAETKLMLPLVMFLMVLIVITVAPALIEL